MEQKKRESLCIVARSHLEAFALPELVDEQRRDLTPNMYNDSIAGTRVLTIGRQ